MAMAGTNDNTSRIARSAALTLVISVAVLYLGDRFGMLMDLYDRPFLDCYMEVMAALPAYVAASPLSFSFEAVPLLYGCGLFLAVWLVWLRFSVFIGNYRAGEEAGSARWGTRKEGEAFRNADEPDSNILLTEHYAIATRRKDFDLEHDRNLNVMVIGGSGSGKTRYYVKPNLMQMNASFFVTDPKASLIEEVGGMFADPESGYRLKCFNTIDFSASMHYNPLAYVRTDSDVLSFVNCFIANTDGDGTPGDPFWGDSMRLLLTALIFLLRDWFHPKYYSLSGVLTLLSMAEAREGDESFKSPLDLLFLQIETGKKYKKREGGQQRPASAGLSRDAVPVGTGGSAFIEVPSQFERRGDHVRPADRGGLTPDEDIALGYYNDFRVAAGKTLKSILITCNTRLARIRLREVREILKDDEMELDKMGDPDRPKTALIACMSDTDKSFSFLHAIMMWQTINLLCNRAAIDYHGKLPVPVNFIFDEFANIGTIPDIEQTIAVVRSRNIGITVILQSMAQLEARYDKNAKTIIDCCDTTLFLGGKSNETNREISEMIGKQTINQLTFNESSGQSPSASKNMQIQGRDLIDAAEIAKLSRRKAILLIAGASPLMDDKYPFESHPRYALIDPGHKPVPMLGGQVVKGFIARHLARVLHLVSHAKFTEPFDFKGYLSAIRAGEGQKGGDGKDENKDATKA